MLSNDPIADFHAWDAEQYEELKKLPVCDWCGEHIMSDYFYDINGEYICENCMDDRRRSTDDYLEQHKCDC